MIICHWEFNEIMGDETRRVKKKIVFLFISYSIFCLWRACRSRRKEDLTQLLPLVSRPIRLAS